MKNLLNKGKAAMRALEKLPVIGPVARYSNPVAELYFDAQMVGDAAKAGAATRRKLQPIMDTMADQVQMESKRSQPMRQAAFRKARQARRDIHERKRVGKPYHGGE